MIGLCTQEWVPSPESPCFNSVDEFQFKLTIEPNANTWSGDWVLSAYNGYPDDPVAIGWANGTMEAVRVGLRSLP